MRVWVPDPSRNLISAENLGRIKGALTAGPVFGYWYRPNSGLAPAFWLARDFFGFERALAQAQAQPGDRYMIWSLPALLARGLALAAARHADSHSGWNSLLTPESLRAIEDYLSDPSHEYIAIFFSLYGIPEIWTGARDGMDILTESGVAYHKPGGEAYVFPFTTTYANLDANGFPLDTIERPEYWLLMAQYPNARGEVLVEMAE
jgi:hypothetical protein